MNIKSYVPALAVAAIIGALAIMRPAKGDASRRHDFVILEAQNYYHTSTTGTNEGQLFQFAGFFVYNYDASPGAPQLTLPVSAYPYSYNTNQLSTVLANLANQGFQVIHTDGRTWSLSR